MPTEALRIVVVSPEGRDRLSAEEWLDVVLVDLDDPSTYPESARAVVSESESPADIGRLLAEVAGIEVVQVLSAGVESWDGALPSGISLVNARGAHGGSTAEWAVSALLAVRREIPVFVRQQERHEWAELRSSGLQGAHILILGAGDLGEQTRRRLEGFGCEITTVARTARDGIRAVTELPELLPTADGVIVVIPLTARTRGLVDAAFLAALPDGAVVVNAARGPVVDTDALLGELASGRLRAALDVTDPEPLPADHPLWDAPGVLITPHVGGHTDGSGDRAWAVVVQQLRQLADGDRPSNTVEHDDF